MLTGASHREHCLVGSTTLKRYRNDLSSTEVLTGEGRGLRRNLLRRPMSYEIAAQAAGSNAQIDNVVGPLDCLEVVFNDDNRVAQIAKLRESREKAVVVACVQSDGTARREHRGLRAVPTRFAWRDGRAGLHPRKASRRSGRD